ncbi:MAG: XRE family transcriptional regulator [Rhodospirillales bacterium]|nr:XRE family transcriptional regulator [Rhodospirillales bacterium]
MAEKEEIEVVEGSGNVWRDFGYADADIRQAKGIIAAQIIQILDERSLSVRKAEKLTGFAAADFSRVRNAKYGRFSIERLIKMLQALNKDMEVTVNVRQRSAA